MTEAAPAPDAQPPEPAGPRPKRSNLVFRIATWLLTFLCFYLVYRRTAGAAAQDGVAILGYPQDGPFRADAARVIRTQDARGKDIYQQADVVREIYSVRGLVRQGNSGGPLIDTDGRVLGVVFAAAADDQTIGYVLTWDEVAEAADEGRTATRRVSTRDCG